MNMPWHVHPLKQRETSEGTEQLAAGLPPGNDQQSSKESSYSVQALRQAQGERCGGWRAIQTLRECEQLDCFAEFMPSGYSQ